MTGSEITTTMVVTQSLGAIFRDTTRTTLTTDKKYEDNLQKLQPKF